MTKTKPNLDPCGDYSWPPKVSGILNLTGAKCTPDDNSPGPKYKLPSLLGCENHDPRSPFIKAPCITIKGRNNKTTIGMSPGPIYRPKSPDRGPAYSIKGRYNYRLTHEGPGPYKVKPIGPCNPGKTMGVRFKEYTSNHGPGPAAYKLPSTLGCDKIPDKTNAPCYSIRSKNKYQDRCSGPGPGTYTIRSDCTYKLCPPKYTIAPRVYPPTMGCPTPGPGAYCIERVRNFNEPPHYSFGIKWCEKVNSGLKSKKDEDDIDTRCPINC